MGIAGSVTATVASTSVTLPESKMHIIGASVYAHTVSGYLSIPIDSTRNALIPFTAAVDVTTLNVPGTQSVNRGGIRAFHFDTSGSTLNFTGTGLTSGTFVFYYGTNFRDSTPLEGYAGIAVSFTTGTSLTFTFPAGPIKLTGAILVTGTSTAQTNRQIRADWATGAGRSVFITFGQLTVSEVIPLDNLPAAQSLTITLTYAGTHVGTGYLIVYYSL